MSEQQPQWSGDKRRDGLVIVTALDGYVIMPAEGTGSVIDRCPCCDEPFPRTDKGRRGARLVADMLYPIRRAIDVEAH